MKDIKSFVPVSSIEFDKIYRVMDKRVSLGYSDRELSFLLGYRPLYVRDVENPLHTLRYTAKDTNYLLDIFECSLQEIMAPKIRDTFYPIKIETQQYAGGITYKIWKDNAPDKAQLLKEFTAEIETSRVMKNTIKFVEVNEYLSTLFNNGYFNDARTALEIFKHCKAEMSKTITPFMLSAGLGSFTARKKTPKIIEYKNDSARTVYRREG
jgi:hypothetical protein